MELEKKWNDLGVKDKVQYATAIVLFISGITLAFLSFFLTYTIASGSLIYISEAFMTGAGIFGVSIYFKSKLGEFESNTVGKIEQMIEKAFDNHTQEHHNEDNSEENC